MPALKTVGSSGQIALGKQYAGRHVLVDQVEPGVWIVKLGEFIPDNERWLHTEEARDALDEAVRWAEEHPPEPTDLDDLATAVES
ncbi:MAG: hypothetical protein ACNA8S_15040 [Deferrisomatales bacterium]